MGGGGLKVLITGAGGQLAYDCIQLLRGRGYELYALNFHSLDITQADRVRGVIEAIRPHVVINCAAFTRVDDCEALPGLAMEVNARGPENLALEVERLGSMLVHISTDYVFDGLRPPPEPYVEDDPPAPRTTYGRSKLEGERRVMACCSRHIILRTGWLYGLHGQNFPKVILRRALKGGGEPLRVVDDQHGTPTWANRLAHQILTLIEEGGSGLYHATSEGHSTWFEFARTLLQEMGIEAPVLPCTTCEFPRPAPRPRNSILENRRLKEEGLNIMEDWLKDLKEFVRIHGESIRREVMGPV